MKKVNHEILGPGRLVSLRGRRIIEEEGKETVSVMTMGVEFETPIDYFDMGKGKTTREMAEHLTMITGNLVLERHGSTYSFFTKQEIAAMEI